MSERTKFKLLQPRSQSEELKQLLLSDCVMAWDGLEATYLGYIIIDRPETLWLL